MKIATKALTRLWAAAVAEHQTGAHDGPLYQPYLGLYTAISSPPGPGSVRSDLTEAAFTGYARVHVTTVWSGPHDALGGWAELLGPLVVWTPGDGAVPETILGLAWYDASTAGTLLGLDPFDTGVPLLDELSSLAVVPTLRLRYDADYGQAVVIP